MGCKNSKAGSPSTGGDPQKTILVSDGATKSDLAPYGKAEEEMVGSVEGQVVVTFQPGAMGITADWTAGRVVEVAAGSQAETFGVQPGWTFLRVGGEIYELALPGRYSSLERPFTVRFSIGSVQELVEVAPAVVEEEKASGIIAEIQVTQPGVAEVENKQAACWWCGA